MKVEIKKDAHIHITAEIPIEAFAIKHLLGDQELKSNNEVNILPVVFDLRILQSACPVPPPVFDVTKLESTSSALPVVK